LLTISWGIDTFRIFWTRRPFEAAPGHKPEPKDNRPLWRRWLDAIRNLIKIDIR
jgi:hypothetical protein